MITISGYYLKVFPHPEGLSVFLWRFLSTNFQNRLYPKRPLQSDRPSWLNSKCLKYFFHSKQHYNYPLVESRNCWGKTLLQRWTGTKLAKKIETVYVGWSLRINLSLNKTKTFKIQNQKCFWKMTPMTPTLSFAILIRHRIKNTSAIRSSKKKRRELYP